MVTIKPSYPVKPFELRDFSKGRIIEYSVNTFLAPKNSVSNSMNVNFDTVIGSGVVRGGTSLTSGVYSSSVANTNGLSVYVSSKGTSYNRPIINIGGNLAFYNGTNWQNGTMSNPSILSTTAKSRFAMLGNQMFEVNGVNPMISSNDGGQDWGTTNCILNTLSISYTTLTGNFTVGETIQDQTSSATAVISSNSGSGVVQAGVNSASGNQVVTTSPSTGFFTVGDVIKDTTSGAYGTIVTISINPDLTVILTLSNISGTFSNADAILGGVGTMQLNTVSGTFTVGHRIKGLTSGVYATISQIVQPVIPSLVLRNSATLLASGDVSQSPSRIYFSSVVDPTTTPGTITWDVDPITGNWIDINPDDGDSITALAGVSNQVMVFKNNALYRLNVISLQADSENIFNMGTPSQECVVSCQGLLYFFTGQDIRSTDGTYPIQISRLGVQDFIDAIPQSNWSSIAAGTDGLNVYFSIGNITLNSGRNSQVTYNNVVLKYSTRDQTWSTHYYPGLHRFYSLYTDSTLGTRMISLESVLFAGSPTYPQLININNGTTDYYNGGAQPIDFFLETQDIDMNNRAHSYSLSNGIGVFMKNGIDTSLKVSSDIDDYTDIQINLNNPVNVGGNIEIQGHFFSFKWFGNSTGASPQFDGIYVESVTDDGMTFDNNL